jgi:hypothetical protein
MPYRRLPNTDSARLRALETALEKGRELPPFKLAYTQSTFQRVQLFLPSYQKALAHQKAAYMSQVKKSKEYMQNFRKAKMYISHFIQVMNMAIMRGELPPTLRAYYGLDEDQRSTPQLNSEAEVIEWGEKIIAGELERTRAGMSPITNPTIAVVKVRYENFKESYTFQKTLQKNNARTLAELTRLRVEADQIILDAWNEVEESFKDLPEDIRREKAQEYGLIYIYRKNELKRINLLNLVVNQ